MALPLAYAPPSYSIHLSLVSSTTLTLFLYFSASGARQLYTRFFNPASRSPPPVSTTPVHIPALLLVVEGIVGRIKSSPLLFVCLCVRSLYLSSTLVLVPSPTNSKPTPTFANPLSATSLFAPSLFLPEGNALLFP